MRQHFTFSKLISILLIINLIGCTTLQPIKAEPDELQNQIRDQNIINVGDRVRVLTRYGKEYRFQVLAIDANEIRGEGVTVPIDSIVALKSQETSIAKTTLLAGGVSGIVVLIVVAIAPALILAAAAP